MKKTEYCKSENGLSYMAVRSKKHKDVVVYEWHLNISALNELCQLGLVALAFMMLGSAITLNILAM